jgi:hypothetical protein
MMQVNEIESVKGKKNQTTVKWLQHVAHMGEIKMRESSAGKRQGI